MLIKYEIKMGSQGLLLLMESKFLINIFGRIKFGELVKLVRSSACLHACIIQRKIQSYCDLRTKGVNPAWRCTRNLWFISTTIKRSGTHVVLEAPSFTFETFAIAFGGFGGDTGLLKGPRGSGNCGFHRHMLTLLKSTCLIKEHYII